jgi:UDP:flavonoid glycosyltransferase YjiC (YdhE family)
LDAARGLDVDVLATIGRANDPGELGEFPANVTVEKWRDQDEVMPDCSAVICHGGAGTMFGALAYGVPLLVLPQGADQFRNADAVKEARAGTTCDGSDATAIRAAVESLLHDDSYVEGARRIATELAAMPSASEVVHALDEIVADSLGG